METQKTAIEILAPIHQELIQKAEEFTKALAIASNNTDVSLSSASISLRFGHKRTSRQAKLHFESSVDNLVGLENSTGEACFNISKSVHTYFEMKAVSPEDIAQAVNEMLSGEKFTKDHCQKHYGIEQ